MANFQNTVTINSLILYLIINDIVIKKIIDLKYLSLPDIKYMLLFDKNIKGYRIK